MYIAGIRFAKTINCIIKKIIGELMISEISEIKASELTNGMLGKLVHQKKSFKICAVANISDTVKLVEKYIELYGMSCRVYTENRAAAAAGSLLLGGIGALAAVGLAVHNVVTFNPDYEIGKDLMSNNVNVIYKK